MSKPTVVLVHGAFADTSIWTSVVSRLQERGYPVVAVANLLRGVQSDAAYLAGVNGSVPGPVVLAAHSYGGVLISRVAGDMPNVRALVYVASFQPDTGESALDLVGRYPNSKVGTETLNVLVHQGEPEVRVKSADFAEVVAADLPAEVAAVLAVTQRPVAQQALGTPFETTPAWTKLPFGQV
jgi:pimeloyl-ACP methyl ester carboxylesterase